MGGLVGDITWRTFGAGVVLLILLASYWGVYEHGRQVERAGWETQWAERDADDAGAAAAAQADARNEEQRRRAAQDEAREHAQKEQRTAAADAAGADAAGQRLRDEASNLAASVSCGAGDPAAVARGQAATRAAMVLSDLLSRADQRAGELAAAYDSARIAGQQCEREHDALAN